jgi:mono/diheme cytochrome c family protein
MTDEQIRGAPMPPDMAISIGRRARDRTRSLETGAICALVLLLGGCTESDATGAAKVDPQTILGADAERGRHIIAAVDCGVCHRIPGIPGAHGIVGPSLANFAMRRFIGGVAPNRPSVLVRWVKDAPSIAPRTGMPELPLGEDEARHVAAYLYTLR